MKKIIFLTAAFFCALTAGAHDIETAAAPIQAQTVPEDNYGTIVSAGQQAPDFEVEMICGTKVRLSDFRGKVVVLNFWATWCPPCRAEFKRVQKDLIDRFEGRDFVFLPLSRGEKKETVAGFMNDNGYTFPVGLDSDGSVFALYAEKAIPRNFLIDAEGKIAAVEIGYTEELFAELVVKIENTLKTE